ncbi:MAG: alginate export family protein [Granulosicoccus sp.]|nr:alginate export family protein [Granulosicoccus sp.]
MGDPGQLKKILTNIVCIALLGHAGLSHSQQSPDHEEPPELANEESTEDISEESTEESTEEISTPKALQFGIEVTENLSRESSWDDPQMDLLESDITFSAESQLSPYTRLLLTLEISDEEDSEVSYELGETYVNWSNVAIVADVDIFTEWTFGRQDYVSAEGWLVDDTLDLISFSLDSETFAASFAYGQEVLNELGGFPVEAEEEDVFRIYSSLSTQWRDGQYLALNYVSDQSTTRDVGDQVLAENEDDEDANLTWIGLGLNGSVGADEPYLDYWFNYAVVRGDTVSYDLVDNDTGFTVEDIEELQVDAWGVDMGLTLFTNFPARPQFTIAFASSSRDTDDEDGIENNFIQTGLHSNNYGSEFDPDLTNLDIAMIGIGIPVFNEDSMIELSYYEYQLGTSAGDVSGSLPDFELSGLSKDFGEAVDFTLPLPNLGPVTTSFSASMFRAGEAFLDLQGEKSYSIDLDISFSY